jgi:hypothetical protein
MVKAEIESGEQRPPRYNRMGHMKTKRNVMTEEEIDQRVITQVDDDSAWGSPIKVRKSKSTSLTLPSELASRAAFFARLHREGSLDKWLKRIIQERLDIEEAAFPGFKKELHAKNGR